MCGIAGFIEFKANRKKAALLESIEAMTQSIAHRGPDGSGAWLDESSGVALGHRRLSIIDLSDTGSQPMASASGRFVITFNGEVYNFKEIRSELEAKGIRFRGGSDTEVLVEAIAEWGIENAVRKCIGMFAFAVWDKKDKVLYLVRDRMGVKPLYYTYTQEGTFLFSSQSKSFLKHPHFTPSISLEATAGYLQFGYLPRSQSIYKGAQQLSPAHILEVRAQGKLKQYRYWNLPTEKINLSELDALAQLDKILKDSIRLRMRSDVPLGAFISGGVDSSAVVAYMQRISDKPIKTFCIGFNNPALDESKYARAVAQHLHTDHTETIMSDEDLLSLIPNISSYYDEPFADFSMLPTMLVSRIARQQVTVSLSGDGGDELFQGYLSYKTARQMLMIKKILPAGITLPMLRVMPPVFWKMAEKVTGIKMHESRIATIISMLGEKDNQKVLMRFFGNLWPEKLPLLSKEFSSLQTEKYLNGRLQGVEDMQRLDAGLYLPDDILTKVDRASMAYGLEAREPLLDHRLVEFAFSLPEHYKVRRGTAKYLLKKALYQHVPPALIERPKKGFSPPLHEWLRGPLRDWAEDLISEKNLKQGDILDPQLVRSKWSAHLAGTADYSFALWGVLMFQNWRRNYKV
jgi:asparagine synthase (glutamine-hydrolysing)